MDTERGQCREPGRSTEREALKAAVWQAVDAAKPDVLALVEELDRHPELGYKEVATAARVQEALRSLGLSLRESIALTGLRAEAAGRSERARVALVGELDAVVCFDHPAADPATGAAHACGHHLQIAAAFAALSGLVTAGALPHLDGRVVFLGVPAEESIDLEFRQHLMRTGRIRFLGGKQEFLRLGEFDDLDAVLMLHADSDPPAGRRALLTRSSNGFLAKSVRYVGREAHAGAFPWDGVNALNACLLGLMGIHAQRETFREEDVVRVHPIITRGGDAVNVVPADVRMETYVRAASVEAIREANVKVSRALRGGALSVGAGVEINNLPGYLPLAADPGLNALFAANLRSASGMAGIEGRDDSAGDQASAEAISEGYHMAASTDAGDVSQYRPAIHPIVGGVRGKIHTREFALVDPETALFEPAKALAGMVIDLLSGEARQARAIREAFRPRFTREGYVALWEELCREKA